MESGVHQNNAICDRKRNYCGEIKDVFIWAIPYIGSYKIDCCGNIWSLKRTKTVNNRKYGWAGKKLSSFIDENGYRYASISNGTSKRKTAIHTLVLSSFVGPPNRGQICRHLDGNPLNNCVWNLKWGDFKENYEDSRRHKRNQEGDRSVCRKLNSKQVKEILESNESSSILGKKYKVASSTIRAVKIGQNWKSTTKVGV